jgi:predicted PurR-regulated permease PerM
VADSREAIAVRVKALVLAVVILAALYLLLGPAVRAVLIAFLASLVALALHGVASWISRHTRLPYLVALPLVILLGIGAWVAFGMWLGPQLVDQLGDLDRHIARAYEQVRGWLRSSTVGQEVQEQLPSKDEVSTSGIVEKALPVLGKSVLALVDIVVILFVALFLAIAPGKYLKGIFLLFPRDRRERAREVLGAMAHTLRLWLIARLILMVFLGTAFGLGLFALGIPLAVPLGLIAGLFNFVPYVGPLLSYFPAAGVALLEGPMEAVYVTILYVVVQMVEGYVAEPAIEARAVSIPPALILLGQVVCVLWLGPIGVLLATPLLVVAMVLVKKLYVEGQLGEQLDKKDASSS